jgi:hypothetical protein
LLAGPSEDDINPGQNGSESHPRNLSNPSLEDLSIERDNLGNVGNGRLSEAGLAWREKNIARSLGPLDLRSEGHADNRGKGAAIQSIALNDEDGSTKSRSRANWVTKVSPPNFTLPDHHSELWRTLRAAR